MKNTFIRHTSLISGRLLRPPLFSPTLSLYTTHHYSSTSFQTPESIRKLVPNTGLVHLVTSSGFKKSQCLDTILKQVKKSGSKLVVVNVSRPQTDSDPQVVCKIVEKSLKKSNQKEDVLESKSTPVSEEPNTSQLSKGKARKEARLKKQNEMLAKQATRALSRNSSKVKVLNINWSIAPNDFLSQKKSNIHSWLTAFHPVQIFLGNARAKYAPTNLSALETEKRKILKDICIQVCEEVNAIPKKTDTIERGPDQDVLYYYIPKNSVDKSTDC